MGNFQAPQVPGTVQASPVTPEVLLGGQRQPEGVDPRRDQLRTVTSQAASLQQQLLELFSNYPAAAKSLRQIQDGIRGALMAATTTLTQGQEGPQPPQIG